MTDHSNVQTYHLYGRKTYPDPLSFIESVVVAGEITLDAEALHHLTGTDWVELVALPVGDIVQVIPWEQEQ